MTGESRKVTFNLSPEELSFTRKDMTWGQEKGEYKLWIGRDSNANLEASFTIK
ncbi:fibronectin type III-like domain-contianing protein [Bacteroides finegoldii]|uniref:fibronectin type III-like domain-contianing protein n=1 Tax=Bacteroides finegoldii TaxID=338188 RepID=UPI002673626D|nr:fibronectin type III-like domain-contianing protein [Bacteroides finegoldii]